LRLSEDLRSDSVHACARIPMLVSKRTDGHILYGTHLQELIEDAPDEIIRRVESGRYAQNEATVKLYIQVRDT
jgi:hypothetical protein